MGVAAQATPYCNLTTSFKIFSSLYNLITPKADTNHLEKEIDQLVYKWFNRREIRRGEEV